MSSFPWAFLGGQGWFGWPVDKSAERSQFGVKWFGFSRFSFGVVTEGGAERVVVGRVKFAGPDAGLDAHVAAAEPLAADEGVAETALFGAGGAEAVVELGNEGVVFGSAFEFDDLAFGVDAGFQGVLGGYGLAAFGVGAGGFPGVFDVGCALFFG